MQIDSVDVEIIESTDDYLKVKLPFLDVPIKMNYAFFHPRLETGYFKVKNTEQSEELVIN